MKLVDKSQFDLRFENLKHGKQSTSAEMPKIKLVLYNEEDLIYDFKVRVDCLTTAVFSPGSYSIEWTRNGAEMPSRSYVFENSLIINRFEPEDLGKYSCIVTNNAGKAIRSIRFFDEEGLLRHSIEGPHDEFISSNDIDGQAKYKLDKRLKIRYGSSSFELGDTLAIECFDLYSCKVLPKWRRLDSRIPIVRPNSPQILNIDILTVNHAGIYVCETTNERKEPAEVGIKLDFDDDGHLLIKQLNEKVLHSMMKDSVKQQQQMINNAGADELDHNEIDFTRYRLPNIRITFSEKAALSKGERVEISCESDVDSTIQWFRVTSKDGKVFEFITNRRSFVRAPITKDDLGRYRCIASNTYGSRSRDAILSKSAHSDLIDVLIYGFVDKKTDPNEFTSMNNDDNNQQQYHQEKAAINKNRVISLKKFNSNLSSMKVKNYGDLSLVYMKDEKLLKCFLHKDFKSQQVIYFGSSSIQCEADQKEMSRKIKLIIDGEDPLNMKLKSYIIEPYGNGDENEIYSPPPDLRLDFFSDLDSIRNENGKVKVKCSTTKQGLIAEWYEGEEQQSQSLGTDYLSTENFTENDLGLFVCKVSGGGSETSIGIRFREKQQSGMTNMTIYEGIIESNVTASDIPIIRILSSLALNKRVELECGGNVKGDSKIEWKRLDREFTDEIEINKNKLIVHSLKPLDLGLYKCSTVTTTTTNRVPQQQQQQLILLWDGGNGTIMANISDSNAAAAADYDDDDGDNKMTLITTTSTTTTIKTIAARNSNEQFDSDDEQIGYDDFGLTLTFKSGFQPILNANSSSGSFSVICSSNDESIDVDWTTTSNSSIQLTDDDDDRNLLDDISSSKGIYFDKLTDADLGVYVCKSTDFDSTEYEMNVNRIYFEINKSPSSSSSFKFDWYSPRTPRIRLEVASTSDPFQSPADSSTIMNNPFVRKQFTDLFIECQTDNHSYAYWLKESPLPSQSEQSSTTNAVIQNNRLIFDNLNQSSVGVYSCYAMPIVPSSSNRPKFVSAIVGSSKLKIAIKQQKQESITNETDNNNYYSIEYVEFDTDPTMNRIQFLNDLFKNYSREVIRKQKTTTTAIMATRSLSNHDDNDDNGGGLMMTTHEAIAIGGESSEEEEEDDDIDNEDNEYRTATLTMNTINSSIRMSSNAAKRRELVIAKYGETVLLKCPRMTNSSSPSAKIYWFKHGRRLSRSMITAAGDLMLKAIRPHDLGLYTCHRAAASTQSESSESHGIYLKRSDTLPLFNRTSFMTYDLSGLIHHGADLESRLEISFKTFQSNGLLFYLTDMESKSNFISAYFNNSLLIFCVKQDARIRRVGIQSLKNNSWYTIKLSQKSFNQTTLKLNNQVYKLLQVENQLNTENLILYLGGTETYLNNRQHFKDVHGGLNGVISLLKFNRKRIDLVENALIKKNVNSLRACYGDQEQSCKNDGLCLLKQNRHGYRCVCLDPKFHGLNCDKASPSVGVKTKLLLIEQKKATRTKPRKFKSLCETLKPCQNKAKCVNQRPLNRNLSESFTDSYRCECYIGYRGVNCTSIDKIATSVEFGGKGFVELPSNVFDKHSQPQQQQEFFLTFTTNQHDALLMFNDQFKMTIKDGHLLLKYFEPNANNVTVELRSPHAINNNRLHIVHFNRFVENKLSLVIDNRHRLSAKIPTSAMASNEGGGYLFIGGWPLSEASPGLDDDEPPFFVGTINSLTVPSNNNKNNNNNDISRGIGSSNKSRQFHSFDFGKHSLRGYNVNAPSKLFLI